MEKKCNKCNEVKDFSEFYSYSKICKYCTKEYQNKYYKDLQRERLKRKIEGSKEEPERCIFFKKGFYVKNGKVFKSDELKKHDDLRNFKSEVRSCITQTFRRAIKGHKIKKSKAFDFLGCDIDLFILYISNKFTKGMSLENYGEWELDHIVPLQIADSKKGALILNHYSNFQPLWVKDNSKKRDNIYFKDVINLKTNPRFKIKDLPNCKHYFNVEQQLTLL